MKTSVLLTFVTLATTCTGQVGTTTIYSIALKYYNAHLDKVKSRTSEIFIESYNGITEKLPGQIGDRHVTILTWENQKDLYTKHDNKIRHVKIFPARIEDDLIEINFTPSLENTEGKRKDIF